MRWWSFNQQNIGGYWVQTDNLDRVVILQADSSDAANTWLEQLGADFSEANMHGPRWRPVQEGQGSNVPKVYGKTVDEWGSRIVVVHYADGSINRYP